MTAATLDRRLARLEAATGDIAGYPTIFVRFMAPAGADPTANTATLSDRVWHQAEGEDEETFIARVSADANEGGGPTKTWGCVVFLT